MITSKNRLTRRSVLRGAGGAVIGLPFLSAMLPPNTSHAQGSTPLRLVVFFSPGGTLLDQWRPVPGTAGFEFQEMMAPLTPFKDRLVVVDGLDLAVTQIGAGHPHSRGMAGVLTGQQLLPGDLPTNGGNASFADGPSIDQVLAGTLSEGLRFKSLELASGWSTGLTVGGAPHPANIINYAGSKAPIPPQADPRNAFERLFEGVGGQQQVADARQARTTFIMDRVTEQYRSVAAKLGSADKARLDAHVTLIEEAEKRLKSAPGNVTCAPPSNVNSTPGSYDEQTQVGDNGQNVTSGGKVPEKGDVMSDLLVSSLACDLTRVATMQWGDSEASFSMNFLNSPTGEPLVDHHHGYQHDHGFQPGALKVVYNWYARNFAELLRKMDAVDEGDGTLLDNSLVLWVSEIQMPESHAQDHMPFVLAGRAGGKLQGGRYLQVPSQPHNNLLVSILNLFGNGDSRFGHPDYCTGPLSGL